MQILTLTNLYPNPFQPHRATFNRHQLRLLGERHPVFVIAPIAWTDELGALRKGAEPLPFHRRREFDGLSVEHPCYVFPPKVMRGRYGQFYRASVQRSFNRVVAEFQPDLVFAPWAYPDGWAAVRLGHKAGLPVVVKVHGSDVLLLDQYRSRRGPTCEALREADAICTVSADLAARVVDLGANPDRVQVVYDGVDTALFQPGSAVEARKRLGLPPLAKIILSVGNLVPVKAHHVLIDACARLSRDGVDFTCNLVGQGPLHAALQRQANQVGLGERFRLVGAIPHEHLPDWYRAADVFTLPSYSEGVPNVLLEAIACDIPFVASQVGGIPEVADLGRGRLVPPGDPEALARALGQVLARPPQRSSSESPRGRDRSETVDDLERLLKQTLCRHRDRVPSVTMC